MATSRPSFTPYSLLLHYWDSCVGTNVLTLHQLPFEGALALSLQTIREATPPVGICKIVAIDGPAGAGKSTLAESLRIALAREGDEVGLIHMDDLYRGWNDALTEKLSTTLRDEILKPLSQGKIGSYRPWDWNLNRAAERVEIGRTSFLILEGVGAAQRVVRPFATTLIWIGVDSSRGLERVLARDGARVADFAKFHEEMLAWQGREILHFAKEESYQSVHLRFDGNLFG